MVYIEKKVKNKLTKVIENESEWEQLWIYEFMKGEEEDFWKKGKGGK